MQRWRPDSGTSGQETASVLGGAAFGLFGVLWLPERESATVGLLALGRCILRRALHRRASQSLDEERAPRNRDWRPCALSTLLPRSRV
jgi:hypothetical protein